MVIYSKTWNLKTILARIEQAYGKLDKSKTNPQQSLLKKYAVKKKTCFKDKISQVLSHREIDVFEIYCSRLGFHKVISRRLFISEGTVKVHV